MIAWKKQLLILIASLLLAPIVAVMVVAIFLVVLDEMMCSFSTIQRSTPPEGAYTAILVEGNCGATTPMMTYVVIRSAEYGEFIPILGRELRESVPIFERELRKSVLISEGQLKVEFRWPSPTTLLVISHGNKRRGPNRIRKESRHGKLRIEYRGLQDG